MSLLVRPNTPPGDELDGLLRAFFQAEMPDPWPSLEAPVPREPVLSPAPAPLPERRVGSLFYSRLSLAASLALCLGGIWFLTGPGALPSSVSKFSIPGRPGDGSAQRPKPGDLLPEIEVGPDGAPGLKITVPE
jgi:hypothetical protein